MSETNSETTSETTAETAGETKGGGKKGGGKKGGGQKGTGQKKPKDANVLNRRDMVAGVVEKTGLPRARAVAVIDATLEVISSGLLGGKEVRLLGFGNFVVSARKAGKGRDPRSGAEIDVPASKSVRFRPAKTLKEKLNTPE